MKIEPRQPCSALIDQIYNHPNWQSQASGKEIERLLRKEHKQFVVTSQVCNPQESQKSVRFAIYFLDGQHRVKTGTVTLDPKKPEKWVHINATNISTRNIEEVFEHVLEFRNCPQYADANLNSK